MRDDIKRIIRYLLFVLYLLAYAPATRAEKQPLSEEYGKSFRDNDNYLKRGLSQQRLTKDIIQTIGRGLLDPGVISFLGPLLMAGLVALPFLAPSAIIPLAGLVSSVRGRKRRDIEETLGEFVVKELPDIINRVVGQKRKGKDKNKPITLDDIEKQLQDVIKQDARVFRDKGKDSIFNDKRLSPTNKELFE